jgi:ribonuclease P protein component
MLKKDHRGLQSSHIRDLFKNSQNSYGNTVFRVNWSDNEQDKVQFVVIVSKKVHQSAVVRNRLRRRVYGLLRKHFSGWTAALRVAILVKSPALVCTAQKFEDQFLDIMRSSGLIEL